MVNFTSINNGLSKIYWNNTGHEYLIALGIFLGIFIALKIFRNYFLGLLKTIASKTENTMDDLTIEFIEEMHGPLFFFFGLYTAAKYLYLPSIFDQVLNKMIIIFVVYYIIRGLSKVVDYIVEQKGTNESGTKENLAIALGIISKITIWLMGILFILASMGVNIMSLVAGLGVGGIAIAFALQKVLEDIFSSFTIYFDKPFQVGDYIVIGEDSGTVEKIGLKTTRIRHLNGEELVVSNREITSIRVHNFKQMKERRVAFSIGVEYSTSYNKLNKINNIIKKIFDKVKTANLERTHFKSFGDSSLIFEIVYFVDTRDYLVYRDTQQELNFLLKKEFEKEKIEFAFPSQTIYLKK